MAPLDFWAVVIAGALTLCAPVVLAGLGEIFLERTGGFNVGIEGMMLVGAVFGVIGSLTGGFWLGLLTGIIAGAVLGLVLGLATAWGKADIIIVGIAIGLLGAGLSIALYQILAPAGSNNQSAPTQPVVSLPFLADIPLIGRGLADAGILFYLSIALVAASWWVLKHTRFGLRLSAVGDDEGVAITRGISPRRYRTIAAIIAGGFAGLAGASIPLSSIGTFTPGMTGGSGFIALAVVIIARLKPWGLLAGALLFAVFNSLSLLAQTQNLGMPVELYQALPYLATLFVLCVTARQRWAKSRRQVAIA
ncbi:ABC transporter permease [Homoserinimonas hongtaonis]|uniref:ABC transporter permease n=1 Tax=Homoserinimonas hongtaonis TaxID=2079791 RepID=A0A2U1T331_9MICO|nr:ABC transporter permease [Salinibacterium hongtaonis]AWB88512.1 ABC transporter permease [Salinibacterium hongtaonis]PWB98294.1 ABC transporter permease [Salinibacterium hongtaonis]